MNLLAAALGGDNMLQALVWVIGLGLCFWLIWWLIGYLALPEPFNKVIRVLVALVAVVMLIRVIMRVTGASF